MGSHTWRCYALYGCPPYGLDQALDSISRFTSEPDKKIDLAKKSNLSATPEEIKSLLKSLLDSFEEYSPSAAETFLEKLGQFIPQHQIEPVRQEIERFDFDRAREEAKKNSEQRESVSSEC